jgi:hypothetical protein
MAELIRFFPDYGARWCLWASSGNITPLATELGASRETEDRIGRWYDFWEQHCPPFDGWDDFENHRRWKREGHKIVAILREEVDDTSYDIQPEFH